MASDVDPLDLDGADTRESTPSTPGDVTVVKSSAQRDDGRWTVTFTVTSRIDHPVVVRLTDCHPVDGGPDEVGFHPDYDPENWTIDDSGDVVYEAELDPGTTRVTAYGFQDADADPPEWIRKPPTVAVEPPERTELPGTEAVSSSDEWAKSNLPETYLPLTVVQTDANSSSGGVTRMQHEHEISQADVESVDSLRVMTDDLSVQKRPIAFEDAYKVVFVVDSDSDRPVSVRITDGVPAADEPREIGFHPDTDPVSWEQTDDGDVVFEETIAPGATVETAYGIKLDESEDLAWLLEPPRVRTEPMAPPETPGHAEDTDEPADADGIHDANGAEHAVDPLESAVSNIRAPGDDGTDDTIGEEVVVNPDAAESETVSAPDGGTDAIEELHIEDPESEATDGDAGADATPVSEPVTRDELLNTLVEELEERELTDSERTALASALGEEAPNSLAVRLRHVQEQVGDLAAYRDAMEEFIDEHGEATQIVEEFETELAALTDDLEALESRMADVESLTDALDGLEDRIEEVETDLADVRDDVSAGRQWRADVSAAVGRVDADGSDDESNPE